DLVCRKEGRRLRDCYGCIFVRDTDSNRRQINCLKETALGSSPALIASLNLKDRVALVTGGSRGIGRAAVNCFARLGANVVINYVRDDGAAKDAIGEAEATGVGALAVQADVSLLADAERLIEATIRQFGRVDFLVCNAGIWE